MMMVLRIALRNESLMMEYIGAGNESVNTLHVLVTKSSVARDRHKILD